MFYPECGQTILSQGSNRVQRCETNLVNNSQACRSCEFSPVGCSAKPFQVITVEVKVKTLL